MKEQIILAKNLTIKDLHNHEMLRHCNFSVGKGDFVIISYSSQYVKELIQFLLNQNTNYSGCFLYHGETLHKKHSIRSFWVSDKNPLIETVSISENIMVYQSRQKFMKLYHSGEAYRVMKLYTAKHPLPFDLEAPLCELKNVHKYMIFMLKAVLMESDVVLLDEVPDDCDVKELLWIRQFIEIYSKKGISFLQFTRKEGPLLEFSDYIYFIHAHTISYLMFKDEYNTENYRKVLFERHIQKIQNRISVADYQCRAAHLGLDGILAEKVELDFFQGEVFSILDLSGCFSSKICQYLRSDFCDLELDGKRSRNYREAVEHGLALVSFKGEDPMFPPFSAAQNLSVQILKKISRGIVINRKMEKYITAQYMNKINVQSGIESEYSYKWQLIVYRWLMSNPKLMVLEEPLLIDLEDNFYKDFQNTVSEIVKKESTCLILSNLPNNCLKISDRVLIIHDREHYRLFDLRKEDYQEAYNYIKP